MAAVVAAADPAVCLRALRTGREYPRRLSLAARRGDGLACPGRSDCDAGITPGIALGVLDARHRGAAGTGGAAGVCRPGRGRNRRADGAGGGGRGFTRQPRGQRIDGHVVDRGPGLHRCTGGLAAASARARSGHLSAAGGRDHRVSTSHHRQPAARCRRVAARTGLVAPARADPADRSGQHRQPRLVAAKPELRRQRRAPDPAIATAVRWLLPPRRADPVVGGGAVGEQCPACRRDGAGRWRGAARGRTAVAAAGCRRRIPAGARAGGVAGHRTCRCGGVRLATTHRLFHHHHAGRWREHGGPAAPRGDGGGPASKQAWRGRDRRHLRPAAGAQDQQPDLHAAVAGVAGPGASQRYPPALDARPCW